ncbi:hypothetical protein PHISP_04388 [Aspergillus sp. HF37]|nr:hypothetical protein PHISP_04388 [Aspergillus sp. HF37]
MLLNLGLTADAAAAHENEFVDSCQESRRSSPKPNSTSFATSSLRELGSLYNRYKGAQTPQSQDRRVTDMSISNVGSLSSSDGEYSLVDPAPTGPSRQGHSHSKKQSSRPKTSYQLAHPVAHARYKRLKLRPRLLLQLQQASHTPRPLPILDVLPSTVYLPRLARKFPAVFRGRNGLGPNDLVIVTSEQYERVPNQRAGVDGGNDEHQEVVATICQLLTEDALTRGKAELCFNDGPAWEATPLPNGSYEFVTNTERGRQTVRWVLRGNKSRRASAAPGAASHENTKRFTFSMIDPSTRRHPVVASMTRNHLEVFDEYSMPSNVSKSPTTATSVASDGSQADYPLDGNAITTDDRLRTLIVVTSIWVAFREGWSHNFSYNDTASTLNSKAICSPTSSKTNSPTVTTSENSGAPEAKDHNGALPNGAKPHVMFPNAPQDDRARTTNPGNKRSNSTSAGFLHRSSRHDVSGSGGRLNRHSMRPKTKGNHDVSRSGSAQREQGGSNTGGPDTVDHLHPQADRSVRPAKSHENMSRTAGVRDAESGGVKPKRRHRFSTMFDFFKKKDG